MMQRLLVVLAFICISFLANAFVPIVGTSSRLPMTTARSRNTQLMMGGNKAKFSYFSPFVVAAKFILGEQKLNKVQFNW